jgi:hypothetical protein
MKLHNEELYFVFICKYYWADQVMGLRWAGHVASMGHERKLYKVLMGKPEGKRALGRPRRGWEDGIIMDLGRLARSVWSGFDWVRIGTDGWLLSTR